VTTGIRNVERSSGDQTLRRTTLTVPADEKRDHIQGPSEATVTRVQYGDGECPYCGEAYPIVRRIQSDLGEDLRFVFRNFPLTQAHPNAEFAAEVAEAGGAPLRFWETHDYLAEHQSALRDHETFVRGATQTVGLDPRRLAQELAKHVHLPRIQEDFMGGVRSGVNGTPTFHINGSRHNAGYDFRTLLEAVRSAAKGRADPPEQPSARSSAFRQWRDRARVGTRVRASREASFSPSGPRPTFT
jgi:protein-disulfide isomerase